MTTGRAATVCLVLGLLCSLALAQTRAPAPVTPHHTAAKVPRERAAPIPRELTKKEAIPFAIPSATFVSAMNYCDAEGNVYLQYSQAKPRIGPRQVIIPISPESQPVTKLSLDSQDTTEFGVSSLDGYRSFTPLEFSVDRLGDVYRSYQAQPASLTGRGFLSSRYVIVKFNDDGSVDSVFRLHNPPGGMLDVTRFVAFADGNLLVTGITSPAPASQGDESGTPYAPRFRIVQHTPTGYGPFTGIFDSSGNFVQQLNLPEDVSPNPQTTAPSIVSTQNAQGRGTNDRKAAKAASQANPRGAPKPTSWGGAVAFSLMTPGPKDTVYLLRPSNPPILYTLSSNGQVIHEAHIKAYPAPEARPISMSAAGQANVMINFRTVTVGKKGKVHYASIFAVVDPGSGKAIAAYRLPRNSSILPACAAGPNDFEFIGSTKHGRMEVVRFTGD